MVSFLLFCVLFLQLFFGLFSFFVAAAASFGSGFLAEITREPRERELQTQTDNSYASEMSGQYLRQGREQSICNISSLSRYMQEIV